MPRAQAISTTLDFLTIIKQFYCRHYCVLLFRLKMEIYNTIKFQGRILEWVCTILPT